jgi:RimJ/RimL family protein N-acetyltransferase
MHDTITPRARDARPIEAFHAPEPCPNGQVGLRRFISNDVPLLFAAARESAPELCAWMTWCRPDYTIEDSRAFIMACERDWERGTNYSFAIFDEQQGTFLGSIGLSQVNRTHHYANVGYWVRSSRTRQGIASEAMRLIARLGLSKLEFQRLEIVAARDNLPSQRVAEKAGAHREGVLRNRLFLRGQPHDAVIYSIIREDIGI